MKNSLKNCLLVLAVATIFGACKGKDNSSADTLRTDSASTSTIIDSTRKDTLRADSTLLDSNQKDTIVTTRVRVNSKTKTTSEIKTH